MGGSRSCVTESGWSRLSRPYCSLAPHTPPSRVLAWEWSAWTATCGTTSPRCRTWKDPVLLDLLDGTVKRLQPSADGRRVHFELANHVKVVTEAAALAPHVKLPPRRKPVVVAPQHPGQVNHE